jgi:ankyrin repeat protein
MSILTTYRANKMKLKEETMFLLKAAIQTKNNAKLNEVLNSFEPKKYQINTLKDAPCIQEQYKFMLNSAMYLAIEQKDAQWVERFIEKGVNVNSKYDEKPFLQHAIERKCPEIVKLLLECNNIKLNYKSKNNGENALFQAVKHQLWKCAEIMVTNGANISHSDLEGNNILHYLAEYPNIEFTTKMLEKGLKINSTNKNSETPLHIAARNGNSTIVELLLNNKADINMIDIKGRTPLTIAYESNNNSIRDLISKYGYQRISEANGITTAEDRISHQEVKKQIIPKPNLTKKHVIEIQLKDLCNSAPEDHSSFMNHKLVIKVFINTHDSVLGGIATHLESSEL